MNITLGKRIGAGFTAVIAITGLLGGSALRNMKSAEDSARVLAKEYAAETEVATGFGDAINGLQLAIRSYGLTADKIYLDAGRKDLARAQERLQEAKRLAARSPKLIKLKDEVALLEPLLQSYEQLIQATEAKSVDIVATRARLDQAAQGFLTGIDKLIAAQKAAMTNEIKAAAASEKLSERAGKIYVLNEIRGEGNGARVATFKSQAERNPQIIRDGLQNFERMNTAFGELTAVVRVAEDVAELAEVKKSAEEYRAAMQATMADYVALEGIGKDRAQTGQKLDDLAAELAQTGVKRTVQAAESASTQLSASSNVLMVGLVVVLILGVLIAVGITRSVSRPMMIGVSFAERVAQGDLTQTLDIHRSDEIGQLAKAMNDMVSGLRQNMTTLAQNADALSSASQEMSANSTQVSSNSEETSAQANVVAAAAEQVSKSVTTVATSAEEMTATIKEIAKQTTDASKVAERAATMAEKTNQTVSKLGESSHEIGNVIKVITSIAEQTNLLALNATIEAARAGEAGKGFAVVANEVKELAKQTAKATDEIRTKIETIQSDTVASVTAIQEIGAIVKQINEIQSVVASSIEEQAATTKEISNNSSEAAGASSEIAKNILSVSEAAKSSNHAAADTATAANELARLAAELNSVVARFKLSDGNGNRASASQKSLHSSRSGNGSGSENGARKRQEEATVRA